MERIEDARSNKRYGFSATDRGAHENDLDVSAQSPHHTLGKGPSQAASGDHKHNVKDIEGYEAPAGVSDHDLLSNRGLNNAHPQYSLANHTHPIGSTDHGSLSGLGDADHPIEAIQGLGTALDNKSPSSHDHNGLVRVAIKGPFSLDAKQTTLRTFTKTSAEVAVVCIRHTSTLINCNIHTVETDLIKVEIYNSSASNHTGIYIHAFFVEE